MKVSNGTIQKIYQEQVSKTRQTTEGAGDAFKKVLKETASPQEAGKAGFHPPSGVNLTNPVFKGQPVKEADPVETMKFAAEVVANQPDVRAERVDQLAALIKSGKYNISPEKVAERLFASGVVTQSWEA